MGRRLALFLVGFGLVACTRSTPTDSPTASPTTTTTATSVTTTVEVLAVPAIPASQMPLPKLPPPYPTGVITIVPAALSYGTGKNVVHEVVVDDKDAFFSDGYGNVWRAPKDGTGKAAIVWDAKLGHGMSLVLDGSDVVFALKPNKAKPSIVRVPKIGGAPTTMSNETEDPLELRSDGTQIVFTLFDGSSIRREPLAGGPSVAVRSPGIQRGALAADSANVFVADYAKNTLSKIPRSGGVEIALASASRPFGLALDTTHVYFSCEGDGSVKRVAKAGGTVQTIVASGQIAHSALVVDETWVYWSTWGNKSHALMRAKKDGSALPVVMLANLHEPSGMAIDSAHVYVANKAAGEILAVPK